MCDTQVGVGAVKTKTEIRDVAGLLQRRRNPFSRGVRSECAAALAIPTRELRRWSARRLDAVHRLLGEGYETEFNAGRRWALAWLRAP